VNNEMVHYFHTRKGSRQGDPLLAILFNLVADILANLISRAKANMQFRGLILNLVEDGLSTLQYVDNTITLYGK
jgi:hypothetical protein